MSTKLNVTSSFLEIVTAIMALNHSPFTGVTVLDLNSGCLATNSSKLILSRGSKLPRSTVEIKTSWMLCECLGNHCSRGTRKDGCISDILSNIFAYKYLRFSISIVISRVCAVIAHFLFLLLSHSYSKQPVVEINIVSLRDQNIYLISLTIRPVLGANKAKIEWAFNAYSLG